MLTFPQKIVGWYNHHCQKLTKADNLTATLQLNHLSRQFNKPHKTTILQYHQRVYYQPHIRTAFDARWGELTDNFDARKAQAERDGLEFNEEPLHAVAVRTQVAKECWLAEDESLREEVKANWEDDWKRELAPVSAKEYER